MPSHQCKNSLKPAVITSMGRSPPMALSFIPAVFYLKPRKTFSYTFRKICKAICGFCPSVDMAFLPQGLVGKTLIKFASFVDEFRQITA